MITVLLTTCDLWWRSQYNRSLELPLWHIINGPLSDAGQERIWEHKISREYPTCLHYHFPLIYLPSTLYTVPSLLSPSIYYSLFNFRGFLSDHFLYLRLVATWTHGIQQIFLLCLASYIGFVVKVFRLFQCSESSSFVVSSQPINWFCRKPFSRLFTATGVYSFLLLPWRTLRLSFYNVEPVIKIKIKTHSFS